MMRYDPVIQQLSWERGQGTGNYRVTDRTVYLGIPFAYPEAISRLFKQDPTPAYILLYYTRYTLTCYLETSSLTKPCVPQNLRQLLPSLST